MGVLELLGKRIVFFDGAMGTILQQNGLGAGELPELWNLERPDLIEQIHQIRLRNELLDVFVPFSARFVRHLHLDVLKIGHACFQFFRRINARMDVRDKAVNATQL